MNIGCQISEKCVNRQASVQLAREPEGLRTADWLDRVAAQLRQAMTLQIPVGFEDEAGFHCGAPGTREKRLRVPKPETIFTNPHQF